MKKTLRIGAAALLILVVIAAVLLFGLYGASQHEPKFYVQALLIEPTQQAEAGDQLEKNVLDLRNEFRDPGRWEAVFTDEQLNGWLAVDLPQKFPDALPRDVAEPRVAIEPELVQIACRYDGGKFSTVVSLGLAIQPTDEPNVVAVRIRWLRAGAVPLPVMEEWKGKLERAALKAGAPLRWGTIDGDDVALVTLPLEASGSGQRLRLETIELRKGEAFVAGRTEPADSSSPPSSLYPTAAEPAGKNSTVQR